MPSNIPTSPGFYWAKWKIADPGTPGLCRSDDWEVVEVYENSLNPEDSDYLRVFVLGETKSQSLENFFWAKGSFGEKLEPPPKTP